MPMNLEYVVWYKMSLCSTSLQDQIKLQHKIQIQTLLVMLPHFTCSYLYYMFHEVIKDLF